MSSRPRAGPILRGVLLFALGGTTGATLHSMWTKRATLPPPDGSPVSPMTAGAGDAAPAAYAPSPPSGVPAPVPLELPPPPRHAAPPHPRRNLPLPPPIRDQAGLEAERALLERARMALARGDATAALEALDTHRSRFDGAALTEEREALSIHALVEAGRIEAARGRIVLFRRTYPESPMTAAVDVAAAQIEAELATAADGGPPPP